MYTSESAGLSVRPAACKATTHDRSLREGMSYTGRNLAITHDCKKSENRNKEADKSR
jgi:hypothetical protein